MKAACSRGASRDGDRGPSNHLSPGIRSLDERPALSWAARKRSLLTIATVLVFSGCMVPPTRQSDPNNAELQINYLRDRNRQVDALLDEADQLRISYQFDAAVQKLYAASQIDPTSERGRKIGAALDQSTTNAGSNARRKKKISPRRRSCARR